MPRTSCIAARSPTTCRRATSSRRSTAPSTTRSNDEEERLAVVLSSLEMIRNGTTAFLEAGTVLTPDAAAAGAELSASGRFWAMPGSSTNRGTDRHRAAASFGGHRRATRKRSSAWAAPRPAPQDPTDLVTGHISLHGLGTASEALLVEAKRRADAANTVLNFHQSYSPADTERDRRRSRQGSARAPARAGRARPERDPRPRQLPDRRRGGRSSPRPGPRLVWAPAASMMWGHGATSVEPPRGAVDGAA